MVKHCELIEREGMIVVLANLGTQPGVHLASKPITKLSHPVQAEHLGRAILDALDSYRSGAEHPETEELKERDKELLSLIGFSSWRKLSTGARRLGIQSEGGSVTITPTAALPAGGYADMTERAVRSAAEPVLVGRAVLEALNRCVAKSKLR